MQAFAFDQLYVIADFASQLLQDKLSIRIEHSHQYRRDLTSRDVHRPTQHGCTAA